MNKFACHLCVRVGGIAAIAALVATFFPFGKKLITIPHKTYFIQLHTANQISGLEFRNEKGKASLVLNITMFFRAPRPV